MKVFVLNTLAKGGAERVVAELVNYYAEKDQKNALILLYGSHDPAYKIHSNVDVTYLLKAPPKNRFLKLLYLLILPLLLNIKIYRIRSVANITAVYSNLPVSNLVCSLAGTRNHIMVVHSIWSKKFGSLLKRNFIKIMIKKSKIISVSNGIKTDLIKHFDIKSTNCSVIYNPFDAPRIRSLSKLEGNIELGGKYVLHVGRFDRLKRQDILISSFSQFNKRNEYQLVFLGEGPLKRELQKKCETLGLNARFIPWTDNPYSIIKRASLLVLCSDYEGFGNVLVEAMIVGTSIISTDCEYGPREILNGKLSNRLFPVGSERHLNKLMNEFIEVPVQPNDLNVQRFDINEIAHRYSTQPNILFKNN